MQVVYVNGSRSDLSWHEMRMLFWHRYFVGIVLTASAIVVALRPYDDLVDLNVVRLTIFYANSVACFVFVLVSSIYVTQRLGRRVFASAIIAFSIIVATVYGMTSATLLGAHIPPLIDIVMVTVFNLVFGVVGEVIFASFLLPVILREIGASPIQGAADRPPTIEVPAPESQPRILADEAKVEKPVTVSILGANFILGDVVHLSADAHYVQVVQRTGKTKILRGRISDAVDAMPDGHGKLVHRSHWVASAVIDRIESSGRNQQLVLLDGKRVPIARSRLHEVRSWVAELHQTKRASKPDALKVG